MINAALLLIAAAAPTDAVTAEMLDCIRRETPRIERIEQSLESVARLVVNIVCVEPLRRVADSIDPRRIAIGEPLIRGFEFQALRAAIEAREARLGSR